MTTSVALYIAIAMVGFIAGALSGSLGVGSGVIVIPALAFLLHCGQKSAQGMALALMVPMALLGVILYARTPGVHLSGTVIGLLVVGAAIGVLAGTKLMAHVPDLWLRRAFAVFLIIIAVRMMWPVPAERDDLMRRVEEKVEHE